MYYTHGMYLNPYQEHQQVVEATLDGIRREASAIDLYSRLADLAPNEEHRTHILRALESKKVHWGHFANLYVTLTGRQPIYQIDQVTFESYRDGLTKAQEAGVESCEEYRKNVSLTSYPLVQQVFFHASAGEQDHAVRFSALNDQVVKDYGPNPFVVNIEEVTTQNNTFRTALWTGKHFQVTLMSINVGDDIGLEVHPTTDQFIRVEQGQGVVRMGDSRDRMDFEANVSDDFAMMIPAGKWHNVINTGNVPLKVYVIYAPPEHPFGTVHVTKAEAMAAEGSQ